MTRISTREHKRLQDSMKPRIGFWEEFLDVGNWASRAIPFGSSLYQLGESWSTYRAAERVGSGDSSYMQSSQYEVDLKRLQDYSENQDRESRLGFGGKVASGLQNMLSYALEFMVTGGVYTFGKTAAIKTSTRAVRHLLGRVGQSAAKRAVIGGAARAVGVAAQTAVNIPRVLNESMQYKMPSMDVGVDGKVHIDTQNSPGWAKAFLKGFGSAYI